jgi:general secretion pathway protein D
VVVAAASAVVAASVAAAAVAAASKLARKGKGLLQGKTFMRSSWSRLAFLAVASAAVLTPLNAVGQTAVPVNGAGAQASEIYVDVNLKDADMITATQMLTKQTGIQFVVEPTVDPFSRITLQLNRVTAEEAIRYICTAAGASFKRDENGVFIIGHEKQIAQITAPPAPPAVHTVRSIKVLNNNAGQVYWRMVSSVPFETSDPFVQLQKFKNLTKTDIQNVVQRVSPTLTSGGVTNFSPQPVAGSNIPLSGAESGNQIALPGESANQVGGFGGGGGGGQGGFGGGGAGGQGGLGGGQGGQGGGVATMQGGQGLVPEGIDFISYNPTDNSLIVQGSDEALTELQRRVSEFDQAPRQVLIKVEFITTTNSLDKDFGVDMLYQRGTVSAGTVPGTFTSQSDPVIFNYATGNITSRLRTFLSEGKGKVVNAPILRTLNNEPAEVDNTINTWVFFNQTVATGSVILNEENPVQFPITTNLLVTPRINGDDTITVALAPQISAIVGTSVDPTGNEYPNTSFQAVRIVARVRNGDTIVLGGLNSKSDNTSVNKVPVLGDLPIVGQFFRHTTVTNTQDELLIFVTPTIVDEATTGNPGGP